VWRVLATVALLAACTPTPDVSVSLYQTRSDTPLNKVEIQVRNEGDKPVTVEKAELRSARLVGTSPWNEPVEVPPGAAMDLKVTLPPADCSGPAGESVALRIDGRDVVVDAPDSLGQIAEYVSNSCFVQDVDAVAAIDVDAVTSRGMRVFVDPGPTNVGDLGTTILFAPVEPNALVAAPGSPPSTRRVVLRPNRCDAHALGEDKQGTYFEVEVTLPDGRSGRYTFGVDPTQRAQLYRLYARMCGLS
jgi:hypothetical protein